MKNILSIRFLGIYVIIVFFAFACKDDDNTMVNEGADGIDLSGITYNPESYDLQRPAGFPEMEIPADNPLTRAGVDLGHFLFFDPILSIDSTMSCASCHAPVQSFTDGLAVSTGVDGIAGTRSSMSLLNIGYSYKGLFWDGRVSTLEEQALLPVEDPIELHNDWGNVVERFRQHDQYPELFRKAFGIENTSEISKELAAKALAQYERTLISSNSKFDKIFHQNDPAVFPEDDEFNGFVMFFDDADQGAIVEAECGHCHNRPLFNLDEYFNNGIEEVSSYADFPDQGFGAVTGIESDIGKFRAPSLRNIEFTAPYMHDGRFQTLEEVVEHYNTGGHSFLNVDPLIDSLHLNEQQQAEIVAFLKMLSDTTFYTDPHYNNPFE